MIVVVGIDGSPVSSAVVARAAQEAAWREAELHAVYVTHLPVVYSEVPVDLAGIAEAERQAAWAVVEGAIEAAGVEVRKVDLDGYPPDRLPQYASQVGAVLLVVGNRGRGELASLFLGSTSHRSIQMATCDVLVVKAE